MAKRRNDESTDSGAATATAEAVKTTAEPAPEATSVEALLVDVADDKVQSSLARQEERDNLFGYYLKLLLRPIAGKAEELRGLMGELGISDGQVREDVAFIERFRELRARTVDIDQKKAAIAEARAKRDAARKALEAADKDFTRAYQASDSADHARREILLSIDRRPEFFDPAVQRNIPAEIKIRGE